MISIFGAADGVRNNKAACAGFCAGDLSAGGIGIGAWEAPFECRVECGDSIVFSDYTDNDSAQRVQRGKLSPVEFSR